MLIVPLDIYRELFSEPNIYISTVLKSKYKLVTANSSNITACDDLYGIAISRGAYIELLLASNIYIYRL